MCETETGRMFFAMPLKLREHLFWSRNGGNLDLSECQRLVIQSCLMRFDEETALKHIKDWRSVPIQYTTVSKYYPGKHYYVLGQKCNSFWEAEQYAKTCGYKVYSEVKVEYLPMAGD